MIVADDAKVVVKNAHFELSMKKMKSSVQAASLKKKYDDWRLSKGAE